MENSSTNSSYEFEANQVTLKDLIRKVLRARWWITISTIVILLFTIYFTYSTPPVYQATASIMIETSNKAQKIFNYNLTDDIRISDEVSVIKSRTIAEDVVKSLWNSNKRNSLFIFGTKLFLPRGQRLRRPIKQIFSFGQWSPEQQKAPQYFEDYSSKIGAKYYNNIINSINVYSKRNTNIIYITASSPNPYEASIIANSVAISYQIRDKEWSSNESLNIKTFLFDRLEEKEKEIENIERKIKEYKLANQIYDIAGHGSDLENNLESIRKEYEKNNIEININREQKNRLSEQLSTIEKNFSDKMINSLNAQLSALKDQVNEKEAELVKNSNVYGNEHEAVKKIINDLNKLKIELEKKTNTLIADSLSIVDPLKYRQEIISQLLQIETLYHQLQTKSTEYSMLIDKYGDAIKLLPEKESYLGKLSREKDVLSNTYSYMRQKMEEARVSMASEPGKVRILNRAQQPSKPVTPDIPRNIIMAIIIAVMLGISISITIEYFDKRITDKYMRRLRSIYFNKR